MNHFIDTFIIILYSIGSWLLMSIAGFWVTVAVTLMIIAIGLKVLSESIEQD